MGALLDLVGELEHGSSARGLSRDEVLARLTTLFAARERRLEPGEADIFDAVLVKLADEVGGSARAGLAAVIAGSAQAPRGIVARLACDTDPDVATPILTRSPIVDAETLGHVAAHGPEPCRVAVAERADLPAGVATALARHGSRSVVTALARNDATPLDAEALALLCERARSDGTLRAALCGRPDLPNAAHRALLAQDAAATGATFDVEYGLPDLRGADLLPLVAEAACACPEALPFDDAMLAPSLDYVRWRVDGGAFRLVHVERWLARNQLEDVVAAFAVYSGLPPAVVQRLWLATSPLPMVLFAKSIGAPFSVAKAFLRSRGEERLPIEQQLSVYGVFSEIDRDTARLVVRHAAMHLRLRAEFRSL